MSSNAHEIIFTPNYLYILRVEFFLKILYTTLLTAALLKHLGTPPYCIHNQIALIGKPSSLSFSENVSSSISRKKNLRLWNCETPGFYLLSF